MMVLLTFFREVTNMVLIPWELMLFWGVAVEFKGKNMLHSCSGVRW